MIVGIDPGLDGAIVFLPEVPDNRDCPTGIIIRDMPTVKVRKGKRAYDFAAIGVLLREPSHIDMVVVEQTQPMPKGKNAQASHGLGLCEGFFRGVCTGRKLPHILYRPKVWQKHFGITKAKGDLKAQSYTVASGLFPQAELTGPRGGKKDGRCDALLIAEYGRLQFRV